MVHGEEVCSLPMREHYECLFNSLPSQIPTGQVSNEMMHLVDLFPTLANFVGGEIPKDRILDGADQSLFLMGKSKKSVESLW